MPEKELTRQVKNITMPPRMRDELLTNCTRPRPARSTLLMRSRLAAAAIAIALLAGVSTTSYAAYNLYQVKNVDVFFEADISDKQLTTIGEKLDAMDGIYSVRYVCADEAWHTFKQEYLDESFAAQFTENPLKDSASYRVTIRLDADTDDVRDRISQLEGVRKVSNLYESRGLQNSQ
ncbi:hypothetical protein D7V94_10795 [Parablautia intestinalis]|uniref:FtsX extracellular domain-containing protein n=1 Tax=Parablautia intestinalis TaxID=2320100 RepID=A0A3A9AYC0_9FIRM|nr:permease-like cell division protein FtsX [Parablautia intestinalis]RKI91375.1 hypothetical protein D7V94_10795 [Parablautia intestinalis]